jgi:hypothetical protein
LKGFKKFVLWTCSLILFAILIIGIFWGRDIYGTVGFFHEMDKQMKIGDMYMESLTDKDIQAWIQRTQNYLKDAPTNLMDDQIPPDLQKLGIIEVEVGDMNSVGYVWLGGMDNTSLFVERMKDGNFQVTAFYNM